MDITKQNISRLLGILLLVVTCALSIGLSNNRLIERLDLLIYDFLLPYDAPPMHSDIVIAAVDDASIAELGPWPWPRRVHAELLDKLTQAQVKAVAFDFLFSEPRSTADDQAFADALRRNGKSVLVVAPNMETRHSLITELLPIPKLAAEAAAIGHVDLELDIDGGNRSFFLYGGLNAPHWPGVAIALLQVSGATDLLANIPPAKLTQGRGWVRSQLRHIPFTDNNNTAQQYSIADIIKQRVPPELLEGKFIVVGSTSTGLGDMVAVPQMHAHERVPEVTIIALQLNGILQQRLITSLNHWQNISIGLLLLLIATISIIVTPTRFAPLTLVTNGLVILCCSAYLLWFSKLWFAPANTLIFLVFAWSTWNLWRLLVEEKLTSTLLQRIEHQNRYHGTTGLPNQRMLEEALRRLTTQSTTQNYAALFVIHIDWPKSSSAIVGQATGDMLLRSVAEKIQDRGDSLCFTAHLSGDDFAMLLTDQPDHQAITELGEALVEEFQSPVKIAGDEVVVSPCIGTSIWPTDGDKGLTLLHNAYTALFKARLDGSHGICSFSPDIDSEIRQRTQIEQKMLSALAIGEFEVHYQPQISTATGEIVGAEALLRWNSPTLGSVSPTAFIPVAENSNAILKLGEWVLQKACEDLAKLIAEGHKPIRFGVNVSPVQFTSPQLNDRVLASIEHAGIPPEFIELEVTESTLIDNLEQSIDAMQELRQAGVGISIDDFGTGFSSLSNLHNFPLSRLKIDKSFTEKLEHDCTSTEIVIAIITMAKSLNLKTIAEGVETHTQLQFLKDHGCEELQGFLYSKPVPFPELVKLVKEGIAIGKPCYTDSASDSSAIQAH